MSSEPQDVPDEELVRQTREGSLLAFEQLVSRHEGAIFRFAQSLCRNETDASEVAQDTFVRAFHALGQYQSNRSFAAWLFGIARRKCIDQLRARRPAAREESIETVDENDPAKDLMRREDGRNIWVVAQSELSASQFEVLWLRFAGDLSVAEIAQVTHRTQTHVKVLLFRARARLGAAMEKSGKARREGKSAASVAGPWKQSGAALP